MGKAYHKPRPSVPKYYWLDTDVCWFCKYRNNQKGCSNCRILHKFNHRKDRGKRHLAKQKLKQIVKE